MAFITHEEWVSERTPPDLTRNSHRAGSMKYGLHEWQRDSFEEDNARRVSAARTVEEEREARRQSLLRRILPRQSVQRQRSPRQAAHSASSSIPQIGFSASISIRLFTPPEVLERRRRKKEERAKSRAKKRRERAKSRETIRRLLLELDALDASDDESEDEESEGESTELTFGIHSGGDGRFTVEANGGGGGQVAARASTRRPPRSEPDAAAGPAAPEPAADVQETSSAPEDLAPRPKALFSFLVCQCCSWTPPR